MANAAFYFGLVRALAESERPLWSQMSFSAAEENFHVAAQQGIDAQIYWPGVGQVRATELVLRRLLPMAHEGLDAWGAAPEERDRLLGIIEQRCLTGVNGAEWFVRRMQQRSDLDRYDALRATLLEYRERHAHQRAGAHLGVRRPQRARSRFHVRPTPLRGSRQPCRVTTTKVSGTPASPAAARAAASQAASTSCSSRSPARVSQTSRPVDARRTPQQGRDDVGAQGVVGGRQGPRREQRLRPARGAHVQQRGEDPAALRDGVLEHGAAQRPVQRAGQRLPDSFHATSRPQGDAGDSAPPTSSTGSRAAPDWVACPHGRCQSAACELREGQWGPS